MLLSPIWGIVKEFKEKFEYLTHETWPRTCGWIVLKFYKQQMTSEHHEICHDIIPGDYGEKLWRFRKSWHVVCLQIEESSKKFQWVVNDSLGFGVKMTIELRFDIKTFCIGNILFHIKFWNLFCYFKFLCNYCI